MAIVRFDRDDINHRASWRSLWETSGICIILLLRAVPHELYSEGFSVNQELRALRLSFFYANFLTRRRIRKWSRSASTLISPCVINGRENCSLYRTSRWKKKFARISHTFSAKFTIDIRNSRIIVERKTDKVSWNETYALVIFLQLCVLKFLTREFLWEKL